MSALVRSADFDRITRFAQPMRTGFAAPQTPAANEAGAGRALLTVVLVLYPALASVAAVVAAFMLAGGAFA